MCFIWATLLGTLLTSRLLILAVVSQLLTGCSLVSSFINSADDYIVEQNVTSVWTQLNAIDSPDYFVWYQGGSQQLATQEKANLLNWLDAQQPEMICVRGTGGSEKFRTLAENRALGVIRYLQSRKVGVDIVKLDYDPSIRGGRVLINALSPKLVKEINSTAPILVIKSD